MTQSNPTRNALSMVAQNLGISEAHLLSVLEATDINFPNEPLRKKVKESVPLSAQELSILRAGGARGLDEGPEAENARINALQNLVMACQTITEEALDSEAVAALLQSSLTEVESSARLNPPALHGFETFHAGWRFPRWQFTDSGIIPCLAPLLSVVGSRAPLILDRFMRLPNCDLEVDGKPLSPRDWLLAGYDPKTVLHLARFLTSD